MNHNKHKSDESVQDYLETIYVLNNRMAQVRSIDIANELSYSKPSVSVAMKNLRTNGYIEVSQEGYISLTESGLEIAQTVYERHSLMTNFLVYLGVDPEIAKEDACMMEHDISTESFEALKKHINNLIK